MNWKQLFILGLLAPGAWEVEAQDQALMYEAILDAKANDEGHGSAYTTDSIGEPDMADRDPVGEVWKVTINGVSFNVTVVEAYTNGGGRYFYAGNGWLCDIEGTTDDGGDFCFVRLMGNRFYFRTPGIYHIKIERMVN